MENELSELYSKLTQKVIDFIPLEWKNIYFFASILRSEECIVYSGTFYFIDKDNNVWRFYDLNHTLNIPKEKLRFCASEIKEIVYDIFRVFDKNDQELWKGIAWKLDEQGNFEVEYLYDEIYLGKGYEEIAWAYEYFGYLPEHEYFKNKIEEYFKDKNNM